METLGRGGSVYTHIILGLLLALASFLTDAKDVSSMYDKEDLEKWKETYSKNISWNYKNVILPVLSREERIPLASAALVYPLIGQKGEPVEIATQAGAREIAVPILSVRFLDDVAIAFAWLSRNGYSVAPLWDYISVLKYRDKKDFRGGRFPSPLDALSISRDVLRDKAVDAQSQNLLKSHMVYLLAREIGGLALTYYSAGDWSGVQGKQNREFGLQLDSFGMEVLRRIGVPPTNMCLYMGVSAYWTPNRLDFSTESSYRQYLEATSGTGMSEQRLLSIANRMVVQKSDFVRGQTIASSAGKTIEACASMIIRSYAGILKSSERQEQIRQRARSISIADLARRER